MSATKRLLLGSCVIGLMILAFSQTATVMELDQKVIGTFSAPVMIPGQTLPPGTYVFKVLDIPGNRDVVRIWTGDEKKVVATEITIPRYRENVDDKEIFQFEERAAGQPQAIKAMFYPGRQTGHEFVYHKAATVETVSSAANDTAPSAPVVVPSSTSDEAAPPAEVPRAEEPAPLVAQNAPSETPQTTPAPAELPRTASSTPLVALVGMLLLGAAGGLKLFALRHS